jgi:bifunctional ADP-heptose synthase (sugar kinase/adenylyltransferase)
LSFVDAVVLFDEDNPLSLIEHLVPNVLVKGGDWTEDRIIGADVVRKAGGVVKSLPFVTGYSTTALIEKMGNRKK